MRNSIFSVNSLAKVSRFLWGAALFTLPITSFRYFPFLGDSTYVRPLSLYPIALLLPLLLVQLTRGKTSVPLAGTLTPLLGFVLSLKLPAPTRSAVAGTGTAVATAAPAADVVASLEA